MENKHKNRLAQLLKETGNIIKRFDHQMSMRYLVWKKEVDKGEIKSPEFKAWLLLQGNHWKDKDLEFASYLYRTGGTR